MNTQRPKLNAERMARLVEISRVLNATTNLDHLLYRIITEAADLTNVAVLTVTSPDGLTTNNTATTDTEVLTRADVGLTKTGPITATAGILWRTNVSKSIPAKPKAPSPIIITTCSPGRASDAASA